MITSDLENAAMTVKEFMAWAQISHTTTYKQIKSGNLVAVKCGRRTLIKMSDAKAWLQSLPELS